MPWSRSGLSLVLDLVPPRILSWTFVDSSSLCVLRSSPQITKSFFLAIENETVQQQLLKVMFDLLLENTSPLVANTISSVFKRVRRKEERKSFPPLSPASLS